VTEVQDQRVDRDALAVEDARRLRAELEAARLLPSLDPRLEPLLEIATRALDDVRGERSLEAALASFAPVTQALAGWPAPLGAPPSGADGDGPARRPTSWWDRRVLRLGAVVTGLEALAHGRESQLGRRLARASVELADERPDGIWWLPMAAGARRGRPPA
jgi:hypothetical protein